MKTLSDILKLSLSDIESKWKEIDEIFAGLNTFDEQKTAWNQIAEHLGALGGSKGHPFFRLGELHLLSDANESHAVAYLEAAYEEDKRSSDSNQPLPEDKAAYRILCLIKDFLKFLQTEAKNWEREQLQPPHRETLINTLLTVYNLSTVHILDSKSFTYQAFITLIGDKQLSRFAVENYFCAINLTELFTLKNQHIDKHTDKYPLARAIVGLYAGVLEALLCDRLPSFSGGALGLLINKAHEQGIIKIGSKLAALSSIMNYLRKHIHPDRDAKRTDYFIDMNVAKGTKVVLDWTISELLQERRQQSNASVDTN